MACYYSVSVESETENDVVTQQLVLVTWSGSFYNSDSSVGSWTETQNITYKRYESLEQEMQNKECRPQITSGI